MSRTGDLSGKLIVSCSLPMNDENTGLLVAQLAYGGNGGPELAYRFERIGE